MSTVAIRNPFALKGIPPKPVRLKNIRGESPTATILHFERVSRLLILDLEAEKAVDGSKRFGILSPNASLGVASCIFGLVGDLAFHPLHRLRVGRTLS